MFQNKGITYKLILYVLSSIIIIFSIIMAIDFQASREILMRSAQQNASNLALTTEKQIETILRSAQKIPENLAPIIENKHYSETEIKGFLSSFVKNNDEIFGSCLAYEPYSYDPLKYYFAPYYYKDSDSVAYKNLGVENYQYFDWNWYRIPKKINKPYWTEPYFDESGGNIIMSTYSVPFYKQANGMRIFNGIITVDIDLSWLNSLIDSIEIIKNG
ncbi:MAG: cache domain-containing protein, partial [Bacteroidales bacterium]|nr:cache domain-containing protein [Bacteroidales bacterium]